MVIAAADSRRPIYAWHASGFGASWGRLVVFLIVGYLAMGRSFAYLGLPWLSLYVGELALAAFLLFGPETKGGHWLYVARRTPELRRFWSLLMMLLAYGALEALRGVFAGYPAFTAARDTAFNYYPLFLFLGIWVGLRERDLLSRVVRVLAWWNGLYGLTYALFLGRVPWTMPGTANAASAVQLFGQPGGSAIALLGLIALEPQLRRVWHLVALNLAVLLGVQVRAEWVAFAVGLLVFAWCTKRIKQLALAGAFVAALVGVMYVARIDLPSPETRGGRISAESIVARAAAPISRDFASELAPDEDVAQFAGNATWRLVWWGEIWNRVNTGLSSTLFGLGYGYPIGELNPFIEPGEFIQTPHNSLFYALAFSGWFGVALFALLQLEIRRQLLRSYRISRQPFGLICWSAVLAGSMFEGFFEGPMGAIPFYLLVGIALAPGLLAPSSAAAGEKGLTISPHKETSRS